jgi:transcriptional regulator with XRE-family HTH domain
MRFLCLTFSKWLTEMNRTKRFLQLAEFFKKKRIDTGLSQLDIAKELGYGSSQIVSNWERGLCSPPMNALPKLAAVLKLKKNEIIKILNKLAKEEIEELLAGSFPPKRSKRG